MVPLTDSENPVRYFDQVIKRPVAATAIIIALAALAAHAVQGLESSVEPGPGRPAIGITVRYHGASPAVIERDVIRPIERRVTGIRGIVRTEATARETQGRVDIYFDFASDLRRAFQAIHDSVAAARRELPDQADEPVITQGDRGGPAVSLVSDAPGRPTPPHRLTLMMLLGLVLVVGLWIDDVIRGTKESTGVLVVGALTTFAIFGPLSRAGGVGGTLLATVSLTVVVGALASSVVSLSVVPILSRVVSSPASAGRRKTIARFARLDCWFDGLTDRYHERLAWTLSNRTVTAVAAATGLVLVVALQTLIGKTDLSGSTAPSSGAADTIAVDLAIRGPDSRTLLGVAQRVADDARRVPAVLKVSVSTTARNDSEGPAQIDHLNGERVIRVHALARARSTRDVNRDVMTAVAVTPPPPGYRIALAGSAIERTEMLARLTVAVGIAVVLVYVILAARWRSVIEPITVVIAIPISLAGVLAALLVTGTALDLLGIVGGAFAAALTVRHAVPIVDAAQPRRTRGLSVRVSLIDAARRRFRAIAVTGVVLVAWMAPFAFAGDDAGYGLRTLGIAVVGGIVASALVTLFVVPMLAATVSESIEGVRTWKPVFRATSRNAFPLEPGD